MDPLLNIKIICQPEKGTLSPVQEFGDEFNSGRVVVRSSNNSELLYVDGACDGGSPVYVGVTKSRGSQQDKLPVEAGDILGGLQVYGRTLSGKSLGYSYEETPLCGSIVFKVAEGYETGSHNIPTELLVVTGNPNSLQIKLIVDPQGNLKVSGNIETGNLTITDELVVPLDTSLPIKYIKVKHNNTYYAMPLYQVS